MKKSKFTGEQIAPALRQAEVGTPVAEVCRKMGVSEARIRALNEVIPPIVPMGTTATRLFGRDLVCVSSCCTEGWCPVRPASVGSAPAEPGTVAPHAMQNDSQLARHGDAGLGHVAALGDTHSHALSVDHFWQRVSSVCAAS